MLFGRRWYCKRKILQFITIHMHYRDSASHASFLERSYRRIGRIAHESSIYVGGRSQTNYVAATTSMCIDEIDC